MLKGANESRSRPSPAGCPILVPLPVRKPAWRKVDGSRKLVWLRNFAGALEPHMSDHEAIDHLGAAPQSVSDG
jgi:hypothetical protein